MKSTHFAVHILRPFLASLVLAGAVLSANAGQPAALTSPANGSTIEENTVTFRWNAPAGATEYYLTLDTFRGGYRLFSQGTGGTSLQVPSLPSGATVYATLYTKSEGVWLAQVSEGSYQVRQALANPCHLPITGRINFTNEAFMDPAQPGFLQAIFQGTGNLSSLGQVSIPTTQTPVNLATGEQKGSSRVIDASGDMFFFNLESFGIPDNPGNPLSAFTLVGRLIVTGGTGKFTDARGTIPYQGRSLPIGFLPSGRIAGEAFNDLAGTITVAAQAAAITSPAPGSGIGSSNVTFSWNAPLGATEYYLTLDTFRGGYRLFSRGTTNTSIVVPSLPRGTRVYATLYTKCNGRWLERHLSEAHYDVAP